MRPNWWRCCRTVAATLTPKFDNAAVIGPVQAVTEVGHPTHGALRLTVDGVERQNGDLSDMIWPVADVVSFASRSMTLAPGDVFMTGTPAGVGPLERGNTAVVEIAGLAPLSVSIAP